MGIDVYMRYMPYVFEYRLKYVGNDVDLWEIAKICGKWLKYLINGLNMWEMTYIFGNWLKYLRNG